MKYINKIAILFFATLLVGCSSDDEKFSGSPVGNLNIIELIGSISTAESGVVAGQDFMVTVTIPQTFQTDVFVEAVALVEGNKTTASILVPAGATTGSGLIAAPAGVPGAAMPFNNALTLNANAIVLAEVEVGNHYLLTSPSITIDFGDAVLPPPNISRLQIRFDWLGPWAGGQNDLDLYLVRGNALVAAAETGTRFENIALLNTAPDGEYSLFVGVWTVIGTNVDMPYRFMFRFPDNSAKTVAGVLPSINAGDFLPNVLTFVKTTNADGFAEYEVQ